MFTRNLLPGRVFIALGLSIVAACSSSPSKQPGGASAPSMVGASGGAVTSSDGAVTLVIPAGALSSPVPITITVATSAPTGYAGTAYDIEPTGTRFLRPAALVFQYESAFGDPSTLHVGTVVSGAWIPLAQTTADATGVRGLTMHLSLYGIVSSPSCTGDSDCQTPFQCDAGHCAIPCRQTSECPSPMACIGAECAMQPCTAVADCAYETARTKPRAIGVCGVLTNMCIDNDPLQQPNQPCAIRALPASQPPVGNCPGAQWEDCGDCAIKECTWEDALGGQNPNCSGTESCAYGYCWPIGTGCLCGSSGCPCTGAATDGGSPPGDAGTSPDAAQLDGGGAQGDATTSTCSLCASGHCASACPAGTMNCSSAVGTCIDINSDRTNCGACGHVCAAGEGCNQGSCAASCGVGLSGCSSSSSGCPSGTVVCGGCCTNPQLDPNNCGACGNVCGAGQSCAAGSCVARCTGGGVCTTNGFCASSCPVGSAVCGAAGSSTNTGLCVDTTSDRTNCGTCGHACAAGEGCNQGSCAASCGVGLSGCSSSSSGCPSGTVVCGGCCTNPQLDPNNCGACGNVCGAGQSCAAGSCVARCTGGGVCTTNGFCASSCPVGSAVCGAAGSSTNTGLCVDTQTDSSNCGACGTKCASGQSCVASTCVAACGGGALGSSGGASGD